jgi:hypothetical protein
MSAEADLKRLTLAGVAHHCAEESEHFFQHQSHDPRYCFELFCRAILQRDNHAWTLIYTQYTPLVSSWVRRHPAFELADEEAPYFVNRAFEKMWSALTPEKFSSSFTDLASLLRYLQMCVHSAIVDFGRAKEQAKLIVAVNAITLPPATGPSIEDLVLSRAAREELWRWLNNHLKDEKEQRVIFGVFILGLKPRELVSQFKGIFRDVNEVYQVKENVMARLRRDRRAMERLAGIFADA